MPLPGFPTSVKGSAVAPTEPLLSFWILFSLSHSPHIRSFSPSSRAQPEPSTSHQSPATALAKPVISHLDKSECHTQWVPGFTLAARAPLNGGHSPITNQIASRPYPKSAEFHITFRTESKVHTRVHKAPSDLGYYLFPTSLCCSPSPQILIPMGPYYAMVFTHQLWPRSSSIFLVFFPNTICRCLRKVGSWVIPQG